MARAEEGSMLFDALNQKARENVEFDDGLSRRVDQVVIAIQNEKDEKQKSKLVENLIVQIHRLLMDHINRFYAANETKLLKEGLNKEDVYMKAVELLLKYVGNWEDREKREQQGEVPAGFNTYVFHSQQIDRDLYKGLVKKTTAEKRQGKIVSMYEPLKNDGENQEENMESVLSDKNALGFSDIMRGVDAGQIFNQLYTDENPFLSLVIILRFGLGQSFINKWKEKFDLSRSSGKISKINQKYIPRVDEVLSRYDGKEMTDHEVAEMFGVSRQAVDKSVNKSIQILKEKFNYMG